MPRASRKDRKIQRQRATNAADRGLPAPILEPRGVVQTRKGGLPSASDDGWAGSTEPKPSNRRVWIKILGLATLALLGLSLWRTLSSSHETNADVASPVATAPLAPAAADQSGIAPREATPQTGAR